MSSTDDILRTEDLTKTFEGIVATDHLDYRMERGEVQCIIGPNGAGKTTFFNLITGMIQPDGGAVFFDGENVTDQPIHQIARRGMVRKYQTPSVYDDLSIRRNINIAFGENGPADREDQMDEILDIVRLTGAKEQNAGSLDHGSKQWLEIGMVLANNPKLVLLDEPTAGMTAGETSQTVELIKEMNEEEDVSIIVIEHDIDFVRQLSSQVTVLHRGSVLAQGTIEDIEQNEEVQDIYLGGE